MQVDNTTFHNSLAILSKANQMLAEVQTIDDAKSLMDMASTAKHYAQKHGLGKDAVAHARSIEIAAEIKLGEILTAMEKATGGQPYQATPTAAIGVETPPTLADLGVSYKLSSEAQALASLPVAVQERVRDGTTTKKAAHKEAKRAAKQEAKQAVPVDLPIATDRYQLHLCDLADAPIAPGSIDCIVTDPPYPREYLPLYETLAQKASEWLKPGGSLLVMVGQSYLPEILAMMTKHIRYHWTLAYLTPGATLQLWQRKSMTGWKPILWLVNGEYAGDWIWDVCKSDAPDKEHHDWGQSESGMADIVERFTYPGQTILDPFMGAGTTGVVAVRMNRLFVGVDVDAAAVATAQARLRAP